MIVYALNGTLYDLSNCQVLAAEITGKRALSIVKCQGAHRHAKKGEGPGQSKRAGGS